MKQNHKEMETQTTTDKQHKVIALYRVSTEKQDLTRQQMELKRALTIDNYTDDQIIEIGNKESGVLLSAAEREGIQEMKRHVEEDQITAVYVHELSRLSRRAADTFMIRDYLQAHRVQLVCINPSIKCFTEDWKIEPTANIVFSVMASMAENEGMIRKERFRTGKARNTEQGKYNGGNILYGYQVNNETKKFDIDEEKAGIVRDIFKTYTETQASARSIARDLYAKGIINRRSDKSREMAVLEILKCKDYAGNRPNTYKQIITAETFEAAQKKLANSKTEPRQRNNQNVVCYALGLLRVKAEESSKGYYTMQVRRNNAQYVEKQTNMTIHADTVDNLLYTALGYYIKDFTGVDARSKEQEMAAKASEWEVIARTALERAEDAKKAIDRLEERYIMGKITEAKAESLREQLENEWRHQTRTAEEAIARHAEIIKAIEKIQSGTDIELADLNDQARADEIHKYIDHVMVERVKNAWYSLTVEYKMSNRPEVFVVGTKKHIVYIVDEELGKVEYPIERLNRYQRATRASRTRKSARQ